MKKLTPILAALALMVVGCTSKQEVKPDISFSGDSASLVTSGINAPATEKKVELTFNSALSWSASAEVGTKTHASWIVINPPAGPAGEAKVTIIITDNPEMEPRAGVITLSSGDITKTIQVTQAGREPIVISELVLDKAELELNEGETAVLVATVIPSDTDEDKTVTWSSSNPAVATVEDGIVEAVAKGTAIITAEVGELGATCVVYVAHDPVPAESISLDKTELTMVLNEEVTLVATVLPENADDKEVIWSSSDETVVIVSEDGVVKAIGEGEAVITATCGKLSATCAVSVPHVVVPVTTVTLDKTEVSIYPAETAQLTATVLPDNADDKTVTWTTSDPAIATVSENGLVTAVAEGQATITAKAGAIEATCQVTVLHVVINVESVTLDKTELTMVLEQEVTLVATVNPANADEKTVTWSTSDPAVATVSQTGVVKAVGEGNAVITAACGGKEATCAVSVPHVNVPVTSVTLNQTSATLDVNQTLTLVATVNPDNADDKTVSWSTSDATVASVSQTGVVKALKAGTAVITASCGGKEATCQVTVKPIGASGEDLDDPIVVNPW